MTASNHEKEKEVAEYWNSNADLWSSHVRKGWDGYREHFNNPAFLEFIGSINGKYVLDTGCGEGQNTRILARNGALMTGIDISFKMIQHALDTEQKEPLGIRYEVCSFSDLSLFKNDSFDAVVSFMALMDGPDYKGAMESFYKVLRRKGELFFSITHPCFLTKGLSWIKDKNGNPIKYTGADYFIKDSWVERWKFRKDDTPIDAEPFSVPRFPRTLSEYINTLLEAGFILNKIEEPRPSVEIARKYPWLQRWREHAALYLYIHAVKA